MEHLLKMCHYYQNQDIGNNNIICTKTYFGIGGIHQAQELCILDILFYNMKGLCLQHLEVHLQWSIHHTQFLFGM